MSNGNNEENAAQKTNDNGENPTRTNVHEQIPLSEPVMDEQIIDPQQLRIINQQINRILVYQPGHHDEIGQAMDCLIFLLYGFLVYQCWPLFMFLYIAHRLITNDNQSGVNSREFQLLYSIIQSHHAYDPNRNAEAEGRTAQPTTEDIRLFATIEIPDHVPLGAPNTEPDGTTLLVALNHTQETDVIIPNTQNEATVPITTNEHTLLQTVVNNPRCNTITLRVQNDIHSSDSSDGEDPIVGSESGFDGDDEDDSANEAVEVEPNVAIPAEGAQQVTTSLTGSTGIIPKPTNLVSPSGESTDEHTF